MAGSVIGHTIQGNLLSWWWFHLTPTSYKYLRFQAWEKYYHEESRGDIFPEIWKVPPLVSRSRRYTEKSKDKCVVELRSEHLNFTVDDGRCCQWPANMSYITRLSIYCSTGEGVMRLQNVVRVAQLIIMEHEEMLTDWLRIVIEGALRNGFSQWLKAARVGIWLRRLCSIQQGAGKTNLLCRSHRRVAKSYNKAMICQ